MEDKNLIDLNSVYISRSGFLVTPKMIAKDCDDPTKQRVIYGLETPTFDSHIGDHYSQPLEVFLSRFTKPTVDEKTGLMKVRQTLVILGVQDPEISKVYTPYYCDEANLKALEVFVKEYPERYMIRSGKTNESDEVFGFPEEDQAWLEDLQIIHYGVEHRYAVLSADLVYPVTNKAKYGTCVATMYAESLATDGKKINKLLGVLLTVERDPSSAS